MQSGDDDGDRMDGARGRQRGSLADELMNNWPAFAGNLVPIAGILFWGWDAYLVLFFFLVESILIGVFNLPKVLMARRGDDSTYSKYSKFGLAFKTLQLYAGGYLVLGLILFGVAVVGGIDVSDTFVAVAIAANSGVQLGELVWDRRYLERSRREQLALPVPRVLGLYIGVLVVLEIANVTGIESETLFLIFAFAGKIAGDTLMVISKRRR